MSFTKFLRVISGRLSGRLTTEAKRAILQLNPAKFYVENVRAMLGVSTKAAIDVCETAVRQGIFERLIEVRRPNGSVAATVRTLEELQTLPKLIRYQERLPDGTFEDAEIETANAEKVEFFRLVEHA